MARLNFLTGQFPVLRKMLELGDYHPDLAGNAVEVWLNLSDEFQLRWREFVADVKTVAQAHPDGDLSDDMLARRAALWAELWNVGEDEAAALFDKPEAVGLVAWMRRRTWEIITEYGTSRGEATSG